MDLQEQLEQMIDRHGLKAVVEVLAITCDIKSDHIRSNWQDRTTASAWSRDARRLDRTAAKIETRPMLTRNPTQKRTAFMLTMPPLPLPQINSNSTSKSELVDQLLAVRGALRILQDAMAQANPNWRDYQIRPAEYDLARMAWVERRSWLVNFAREIELHAEKIDALPGR